MKVFTDNSAGLLYFRFFQSLQNSHFYLWRILFSYFSVFFFKWNFPHSFKFLSGTLLPRNFNHKFYFSPAPPPCIPDSSLAEWTICVQCTQEECDQSPEHFCSWLLHFSDLNPNNTSMIPNLCLLDLRNWGSNGEI